ncbi:hypothetical protein [Lysinibacillus sphaericus]|nr:hypothetical protein [Lysinibacillus sp. SDF0037]
MSDNKKGIVFSIIFGSLAILIVVFLLSFAFFGKEILDALFNNGDF